MLNFPRSVIICSYNCKILLLNVYTDHIFGSVSTVSTLLDNVKSTLLYYLTLTNFILQIAFLTRIIYIFVRCRFSEETQA